MEIQQILEEAIRRGASDVHLMAGVYPTLRIDGKLIPITKTPTPTPEYIEKLVLALLLPEQKELLLTNKELDFSFALGEVARFRVNAFYQKGYLSAALRLIPNRIPTLEELHLPSTFGNLTKLRQGLILVAGPTGHGKSTTIASLINKINEEKGVHVVTVEDPIEYVYPSRKALIAQREMHLDTHSWEISLRSVLREDPDVVLIGEMRDYETIESVLTIAETGHLVFATLHTNSAAQTLDRVVGVFPESQQEQVRMQLSNILEAVLSLRLIPAAQAGRYPAIEVLLATPAVRNVIREGKTHLIDNIIQTSANVGMSTLESSLAGLIKSNKISLETALSYSLRPQDLMREVKLQGGKVK
ncbi:MAG: type IV pili twitching motility protein PilT [Candidatus Woykebacteria bacterium RBG_13_40_15]|uniref:Type IV pili twitching motility protein PilT n=1 Tax=Candidatus Woykebacteria bacterium RBG_13_40_15 TaxID=1802593 RepID=A0A1G1W761_9BACT|nr:MAG: type IV pili twitching motility protein PilT [Candidatus Woykebacteria bacterium RBG_13_40_15]